MNTEALLLDASSEMLFLLDASSLVIVSASKVAHDQLGYVPGGLIGVHIGDIECALSDLFFWDQMSVSGSELEAHGSFRRSDGSVFNIRKLAKKVGVQGEYYSLRARPERGSQGLERGFYDLERHMAATLEATQDGILLTDTDGSILNMNRRFSELWPLPETLLESRDGLGIVAYLDSLLFSEPGAVNQPTILNKVVELLTDPEGDTFERLHLQDGRVIECFSHPARTQGRTIGRVFCYRDVSERIRQEQLLKEAGLKAEQAMKSKSQFLANMSHEIRTPMNAILGMLKLVQDTDLSSRQLDYINKADGAAQSLLGLINDILDFSKIDAGKLELDSQPFEVDHLLRDLAVILSSSLGKKPVDVLFDLDPATPPFLIGDSLRLRQILINLSGNAIKFTEQGEVVLQIKVLGQSAKDTTLRFSVCDSGIGIAPEAQQHIFEDFSQAEASTTRRFGGTGLGLSICTRLVAMMGGELKVQSVLGQGSTFYFDLSLANTAFVNPKPLQAARPLLKPLNVLIVDDNATARRLLGSMAQSLGWLVDTASHPQEALAMAEARLASAQNPYELILMDWEIPEADGWAVMTQMYQRFAPTKLPVMIRLCTHDQELLEQHRAADHTDLHGCLVKPMTASMMYDVVMNARVARGLASTPQKTVPKPEAGQLSGMRVLVVEDNMINRQVAQELLMGQGAIVELAENGLLGVVAVKQASQNTSTAFDAVLMDMQMPVMDGCAATRVIRDELGLPRLPIIAMTANAMASDRAACLKAGMNDHIGKPFDLQHLVKVLLAVTAVAATGHGADVLPSATASESASSCV